MNKIHLIYASKAVSECTPEMVAQIGKSAFSHNMNNNVTGLLCYGNGRFLQVLEGTSEAVNKTYHRIARDDRHEDLRLILVEGIAGRAYTGWAMECVLLDDKPSREIHQIVLKYANHEIFAPEEYSPGSARHFLEDVRDYVRYNAEREKK